MASENVQIGESNLLDQLVADAAERLTVRNLMVPARVESGGADAVLFADTRTEASGGGWSSLSGHRFEPTSGNRFRVQLNDELVAGVGETLESEAPEALAPAGFESGQWWVVNFGNPNATKALHAGHLRQLAVGHALASMHESAGADVVRQTRIGDCGRNVGEALAGYREFSGETPIGASDVKGDHFVGECYARYVAGLKAEVDCVAEDAEGALSREGRPRDDEAERLLADWASGGPSSEEFIALREWVLEGHKHTMDRLGIAMDRTLFESDYIDHGRALQEAAIAKGLVHRAANGATLYPTGDKGYPQLLLCRPDGFPTQHLRYIATWDAIGGDYAGFHSIGVLGSEWRGMSRFSNALLAALHGVSEVHPHERAIHGMVVVGGDVVKSSKGDTSLLIDNLLDRLRDCSWVQRLAREREWVRADEISATILLGYFLNKPLGKTASLTFNELLSPRNSLGRVLAAAWATAMDPAFDGAPDPDPLDPSYRTLVVHSQMHLRLLRRCLAKTEILPLARFHLHRSAWFLRQPKSARLARAMRSVLRVGAASLGLAESQQSRRLAAPTLAARELG